VLVAGVEEQLPVLRLVDELSGGVDIALPDEDRVGVHPVHLHGHASGPAHEVDDLRAIIRHARIPRETAAEFWERVFQLTYEFSRLPRSGETVYGFVAGLYPTDYPTLPEPDADHGTATPPA
jgi:hypothetical protein